MTMRRVTHTEFLDEAPMSGFLWLMVIGICLAQTLDGLNFQASAFALPGIIKEFKLSGVQAGFIGSVTNIGVGIGALFFSIISDRFGRRPVFQWVLLTYAFGTLICALAPNYHLLQVGCLIAGFGVGGGTPLGVAIVAEFAPKRLRHVLVPLVPMFFGLGFVVAALFSVWLVPAFGWRSIYWTGVSPALVILLIIRKTLPESIRYLLSRGRNEEAGRIAYELARKAGVADIELVPPETAKSGSKQVFLQQLRQLKPMWFVCLALALFMIAYYIEVLGLNVWLPTLFMRQGFKLSRSFIYSLIILSAAPVSQIFAMVLQNRFNRRWLILVLTLVGNAFFLLFGLSFSLHLPIWVAIVAQTLQGLFIGPMMSIVLTLSSEIFPTALRATGTSVINSIGRAGAIAGPLILGFLASRGTSLANMVYCLAVPLVVAAFIVVLAVRFDPRSRSLEAIEGGPEVQNNVAVS